MAAFLLQAFAHDERLAVTEHLSELRARLLLLVAALAAVGRGLVSSGTSTRRDPDHGCGPADGRRSRPGDGWRSGSRVGRSACCVDRGPWLRQHRADELSRGVPTHRDHGRRRAAGRPGHTGDAKPGDTNGQRVTAFDAAWFAVSGARQVVSRPASKAGGTIY
jgi:hypothetical protein